MLYLSFAEWYKEIFGKCLIGHVKNCRILQFIFQHHNYRTVQPSKALRNKTAQTNFGAKPSVKITLQAYTHLCR